MKLNKIYDRGISYTFPILEPQRIGSRGREIMKSDLLARKKTYFIYSLFTTLQILKHGKLK